MRIISLKFFKGKSVNKYLLSLMVLLPLSTFTVAQEAEEAESSEVEEVVTTGIRSSLIDAISIKRENDRWEITGQLAERITNLNGNEYDVFNEISYRFENSGIPAELEEMGINKGDLILEFNVIYPSSDNKIMHKYKEVFTRIFSKLNM